MGSLFLPTTINKKNFKGANVVAYLTSPLATKKKKFDNADCRKESVEPETTQSAAPILPAKRNSIASQTSSVDKKVTSPTAVTRKLSVDSSDELEEGMKVISSDSLKNIRQSGSTYIFSFQSETSSTKNQNYLPAPSSKQVSIPSNFFPLQR